ncbi:MAG: extradiol ring-cleavage dioxygenase [Rhodospirillaceae bacterium]|nr:extradiol ring-cleavage dioxygenase [Rhodospirillaceae bacterium]
MARIVLGIGTSHSPALNSPAEDFHHHAARDRASPNHRDSQGNACSYDALLTEADPSIGAEITSETIQRRVTACARAIERLADNLEDSRLDALIIVGDDQLEQYRDDNMPAMLLYCGSDIRNDVSPLPQSAPAYWRQARSQFHEPTAPRDYPVDQGLARHLVSSLTEAAFDISYADQLRRQQGEGHAFGFVHRRLMTKSVIPIVPVILNTYYPPNQPRPRRCYALGRAIRSAVEAWGEDKRVGILASGGLSHFTINEQLDHTILDACRNKDGETLRTIPTAMLNSGNSEIRNWITVAGAVDHLDTDWQVYEPCYRSEAGTGCGMAFAVWS